VTKKELQEFATEMGMTCDEAAHFLVDCGEIDSTEHATLLSAAERKRIYG
jgi:hypothetical protein